MRWEYGNFLLDLFLLYFPEKPSFGPMIRIDEKRDLMFFIGNDYQKVLDFFTRLPMPTCESYE